MNRDQFIQQAYAMAVGKSAPPSSGNKYDIILDTGNIFIEAWQDELNTDWESLYRFTAVGTVSATDTFPLDTAVVRKLAKKKTSKVLVTATDGRTQEFDIVQPSQVKSIPNSVAKDGSNLVFNKVFTDFIGGTIEVPYYTYASKLVNALDEVPVDQPIWLVYMTAAEFVRNNDYIKQNQYPNLIALANEVMKSMKRNNKESQSSSVSRPWTPLGQSW